MTMKYDDVLNERKLQSNYGNKEAGEPVVREVVAQAIPPGQVTEPDQGIPLSSSATLRTSHFRRWSKAYSK
jgi:hypothetical protein